MASKRGLSSSSHDARPRELDLDDLELVDNSSPQMSKVKKESSEAGRGTRCTTPPSGNKRRAVCRPRQPSLDLALPGVKGGSMDIVDAGPVGVAECEALGDDQEASAKDCNGCNRNSVTGRCWTNPSEGVIWAMSNMRGCWCRDCFNLWRLHFQDKVTLVMLTCHLKSSPQTLEEWCLGLLAYFSLRREGVDRVSREGLLGRIETFRWLLKALGLPLHDVVVKPLSEWASEGPPSASHLVTIISEKLPQLGVIVPLDQAMRGDAKTFSRPLDGTWLGLPWRQTLVSARQSDAEAFAKFYSQAEVAEGAASASVQVKRESPETERVQNLSREAKKIFAVVRAQTANAKVVLQAFEGEDWQELREAAFTTIATKMHTAKLEAAEEQVVWLIEKASAWCSGLAVAKNFCRKYKAVTRAKGLRKMSALSSTVSKLIQFLQLHVKVGTSFQLLHLKTHFQRVEAPASLAENFQQIVVLDLFALLASMQQDMASTTPDSWLRALLMGELAAMIETMSVEEVEEHRPKLIADVAEVARVVRSTSRHELFSDVVFDLHELGTLLEAGMKQSQVSVSRVVAAKAHYQDCPRLAVIQKALKSPAGIELMAPAEDMEKDNEHDEIADDRFRLGIACFSDTVMFKVELQVPTVGVDAELGQQAKMIIFNEALIVGQTMQLTTILLDSMSHVLESLRMWSLRRVQERADDVSVFFRKIGATLRGVDLAAAYMFMQECVEPLASAQGFDFEGIVDLSMLAKNTRSFKDAVARTPKVRTADLLSALSNMAKGLPESSSAMAACIATALQVAGANAVLRGKVFQLYDQIADLCSFPFPKNSAEAVASWTAKGDSSFLAKGLALLGHVEALKAERWFDFTGACLPIAEDDSPAGGSDFDAGIVVSTADSSSRPLQLKHLVAIPAWSCELPIVTFVQKTLFDCTRDLAATLFQKVDIAAIVIEAAALEAAPSRLTLLHLVHSLVDSAELSIFVAAVGQSLAKKTNEEDNDTSLPHDDALGTFAKLAEATAVEEISCAFAVGKDPEPARADIVLFVAELHTNLHHAAMVLAWLGATCGGSLGVLSDHMLRNDVGAAVGVLESLVLETEELVGKHPEMMVALQSKRHLMRHAPGDCLAWSKKLGVELPKLQLVLLRSMCDGIVALGKQVEAAIPSYDHILSDDVFSKSLVKSRILNWLGNEKLTGLSVVMWRALADLARLREKFGLEATAPDDEISEVVAKGETFFRKGKKFCTIYSAVKILFSRADDITILKEGTKILENKQKADLLPKTLTAALGTLIEQKRRSTATATTTNEVKDQPSSS